MSEERPAAPGAEYAESLRAVMDHAAARDEAQSRTGSPPPPPLLTRPPVVLGVAVVFVGVLAWNLTLVRREPAPLPAPVVERNMSVSLLVATQAVEAYRRAHGRLPPTLADVGLPEGAFDYRVIDGDDYELATHLEQSTLRVDSRRPQENPLAELGIPLPPPGPLP